MFKKTNPTPELDLFSSPSNLLGKRGSKKYDDPKAWHNQFFHLVTSQIDETVFLPLYKSGNMGAPNASIRVLVAMSILKEGFGSSDEALFEKCEFDLLTRKALGLLLLDEVVPSLDTYYLFRRRICDYEQNHGENLMELCFKQVVGEQVQQFKISGKCVRMDSKLIGSNIAWYSRYEIIHATFFKYMKDMNMKRLNPSLRKKVQAILTEDAQKIVYRSDSNSMSRRLVTLGEIIYQVLVRIKADSSSLLHRVFHEQYTVEKGQVIARHKTEISAKSVQNPNDPDAEYRNKNGKKVKGYSANITETTDQPDKPSLITDVQVKPVSAPDNGYLQEAVQASGEVTGSNVERLYADGAYQSQENREFACGNNLELIISGIQGRLPRFELEIKDGTLHVTDTEIGEIIPAVKVKDKWRIRTKGKSKYRYFTSEQVEKAALRRKLTSIPIEEQNKRNNVEATIFQYCFHTRNNKTRYRGLLKHKLYSYARCLWINCIRLIIFQITTCQGTLWGKLKPVYQP